MGGCASAVNSNGNQTRRGSSSAGKYGMQSKQEQQQQQTQQFESSQQQQSETFQQQFDRNTDSPEIAAKQCECAEKTATNLLESYESMRVYIQSLRDAAFDRLFANLDAVSLNSLRITRQDVAPMESLAKDFVSIRQFKHINRYKYKAVLSEFISSIKECLFKIKRIDSINTASLQSLNAFNVMVQQKQQSQLANNKQPVKIPKKFQVKMTQLHALIMHVSVYLESDQHADSTLSCNYYNLELTSVNSKCLSGYNFNHAGNRVHAAATAPSSKSPEDIENEREVEEEQQDQEESQNRAN